jgi:beta-lactamase regulating signal transducer with metallopeptidase domain
MFPPEKEQERVGTIDSESDTTVSVLPLVPASHQREGLSRVLSRADRGPEAIEDAFSWMSLAFWVWLSGCVLFLLQMIYHNIRFARLLRRGQRVQAAAVIDLLGRQSERIGLRRSPVLMEISELTTPAVFGGWNPTIVLPRGLIADLTEDQLRHVFLHELAHIKRWDLLVHWMAHLLRIVHWFNPIIWFAVSRMRRDCEVATDSLALKCAGEGNRQAYGETILHLLRRVKDLNRVPGLVGIVERKSEVGRRIVSIRDFRRHPKRSIFALAVVAVLSVVSLTRAIPVTDNVQEGAVLQEGSASPVIASENVIHGTVVDLIGNPVPNAIVHFGERNQWFTSFRSTDARGQFQVLESQFKPDLILRASGFGPTLISFDYDTSVTNRTFQLRAPAVIQGVVVDDEGNPIEKAEVIPESWFEYRSFDKRIKSGPDGGFAWMEAPDHGKVEFTVFAKGFKAVRGFATSTDSNPRIQMSRPDRVSGTVVDAKTGEAIPKFKFRAGKKNKKGGRIMNIDQIGEGEKGAFTLDIREPARPFHVVTVLADGYVPAHSRDFRDGEKGLDFRFELQREGGISLEVLLPSGAPAIGATWVQDKKDDHQVWIAAPREVNLRRIHQKARVGQIGAEGKSRIRPVVDMTGLVITHEKGYRELDMTVSVRSPDILEPGHTEPDIPTFLDSGSQLNMKVRLKPWARVEGALFAGGEPVENQSIKLWRIDFESALVSVGATTETGGRFVFEGIPAGEYRLELGSGTNLGWVAVKAGETAELVVGQNGRSIIGRAEVSGVPIENLNWQRESYYLKTKMELPPEIKQPTPDERSADPALGQRYFSQVSAYWQSPEGKALKRTERSYPVEFGNDGTFQIDGVVPGRYELSLQITDRMKVGPNSFQSRVIASVIQSVTVPLAVEGKGEDVIDLGELILVSP